ncbi:MAG: bifunctional folylpolyglutamate synthase/dihydrofolate synthase [Sphingomonadales bacterium]|nr:bifunctional folylpolyglutamate synthase/dihydrofolate synthase [Sphingomonadales bacterium]NCO50423.1 bifunctional folylpolyglutamate synthase/dihydrofolate synthase [Sphingomonadales bacterium]NCO98859.1 bifunctional folylpolyglutamate synthase/dihydrofolate synthase [Sphingomonadales bacterium]NCP28194.1 bifunctional folylpolyglutamate synthase/dihydrofolate synthase [Sphingomonadales bacterium]NCP44696.1 bifunctional folylpolyglutamate synthase/dihydrofolate synthase [Sphingomonadales ba
MADSARSDHPAVQHQLDRLEMLSPGRDVLGLERILDILDRLGNPQDKLPPVFHVAGTNGKGSTCAFLRAAIEAEGLKTHVYTSPHLVRFNERIRLAGKLIEDDYLAELLARVLDISADINPSFFEATTAAAFLAFAETPADACILEVGLGGRLDATNVIRRPVATGIAELGIDHEAFLLSPEAGTPADPLVRIAWEKAGIAKKNTPLLTQKYAADMLHIIADHAADIGAQHFPRGEEWDAAIYEGQLHYKDEAGKLNLPLPALIGAHQADNAALAIAMLRHQTAVKISDAALKAAMGWAQWPGRMHFLIAGPVTHLLPSDAEVWVDGGHNVSAGLALAKYFADYEAGSIDLVIGMLDNKDPAAILTPLHEKLASVTVIPVPGHESHALGDFPKVDAPMTEAGNISAALRSLEQGPGKTVLIAGSLYLAGEVLKANEQVPD